MFSFQVDQKGNADDVDTVHYEHIYTGAVHAADPNDSRITVCGIKVGNRNLVESLRQVTCSKCLSGSE